MLIVTSPGGGTAAQGYLLGRAAVDVSGAGTVTLTSGQYQTRHIDLGGTLTGDRTVVFPVASGGAWVVRNTATGPYLLALSAGTGSVSIGPGQALEVSVDGTGLMATDGTFGVEGVVSHAGSVGTTDTAIARLPAGVVVTACWIAGISSASGGTVTYSVGTSSGGAQLLAATAAPAAGALIGDASAELGADLSATGKRHYASAQTVYLRKVIAGSTVVGGSARFRIWGIRA